ncbi:MAG TPA: L,D-transpeptidase family protein [Chthonomonadaceae bacterium]|nr:L,D-transpeptidase family protein [Chthonomonadaceae bacterium]
MLNSLALPLLLTIACQGGQSAPSAPNQAAKPPLPASRTQPLPPVIGAEAWYTVQPGDTLLRIARRYGTDRLTLAQLNHLTRQRPRPGTRLLLPTRFILPAQPQEGCVLNIPERGVYVFRHGQFLARYPTAVGRPSWPTPTGTFKVECKIQDPIFEAPEAMVRREGARRTLIPPGPRNPLGDRWMGWSGCQVGFHSTPTLTSIGRAASHGCVRLYPEAGHRMFGQVRVGMPIYSLYQPVKIGQEGNRYYLSVSPDIYHRGLASLAYVEQRLKKLGLLPIVDLEKVREVVALQDGYPHCIGEAPKPTEQEAPAPTSSQPEPNPDAPPAEPEPEGDNDATSR